MRRFELQIKRGRNIETKVLRAVQMSSVVAEAEDMLRADYTIDKIMVTNLVTDETIIVK